MLQTFSYGFSNLYAGARMVRVWYTLAREDVSDQHRRTFVGPLWLLISYLLFACTFIFVFAQNPTTEYATHAAVGLFVWYYFTDVITNASMVFVREEAFIKGTRLPLSVYVFRLSTQAIIRAGYSLIGCLLILAVAQTPFTSYWLVAIGGLVLIIVTTPAVVMIFALLGVFIPDTRDIVNYLMRIGMFLTPIFWQARPGQNGIRGALYAFDPFTYYMEIVRIPIQSAAVPGHFWLICLAMSAAIWIVAIFAFGRFRDKVVFYL